MPFPSTIVSCNAQQNPSDAQALHKSVPICIHRYINIGVWFISIMFEGMTAIYVATVYIYNICIFYNFAFCIFYNDNNN